MSMDEIPVRVASMFGYHSREPRVTLQIGDRKPEQFPPTKAREIAVMLLEAAESAEQDAFLINFAMTKLDCTFEQAGVFLLEFRTWRDRRETADGGKP